MAQDMEFICSRDLEKGGENGAFRYENILPSTQQGDTATFKLSPRVVILVEEFFINNLLNNKLSWQCLGSVQPPVKSSDLFSSHFTTFLCDSWSG